MTRGRWLLLACLLLVIAGLLGAYSIRGIRWRSQVALLKLRGQLPELSWGELAHMVDPRGPYYLEPIVRTRSPYASVKNPYTGSDDIKAGLELFAQRCASCHGSDGAGKTGPDLTSATLKHGSSQWALYKIIQKGMPGTGMPPHDLGEVELWRLVAAVDDFRHRFARGQDSTPEAWDVTPVTPEHLVGAAADSGNWLMYHGAYNSWRHSRLREIDTATVTGLHLLWVYQTRDDLDRVETTPLVVGDMMFITEPNGSVAALDAETGSPRWTYSPALGPDLKLCCTPVNRGVAILGTSLYLGTPNAHLIALDARTGKKRWDVTAADNSAGYSFTSAPLTFGNLVVIGVAGGEFGIRGFIDAYDAESGRRVWRFYTIPDPGAPGSETWKPEALATGGGPAWLTGSYDPELGLIYMGIGNPGPVYNGAMRGGDNLYTSSVVALRATTGELVWHFQFTPHDTYDYDAAQVPVLVDAVFKGQPRRLMLWANKNAFYYVLDRTTGEFLTARPFATQTWTLGLDSIGRPIPRPEAAPSRSGAWVFPSTIGATNWWSPSYSPRTGLFYIPVREQGAVFFVGEDEYQPGETYLGSRGQDRVTDGLSAIRAVDALTGELQWEHRYSGQVPNYFVGGILTTAGGLAFTGNASTFEALHDRTGKLLWSFNVGSRIIAAPITWLRNGRQRVSIAAGRAIFTFGR